MVRRKRSIGPSKAMRSGTTTAEGLPAATGCISINNNVFDNGKWGSAGAEPMFVVQSNQISYNNYAGYSYYWEAGGAKFASVQNLMVEYNYSHNNGGPGLWNDINSEQVTYNENETSNNIEAGILSEISSNITVTSNYILDDGFNPPETGFGGVQESWSPIPPTLPFTRIRSSTA